MSKFYVAGSCGVIQSAATLKDIQLLEKYQPKALAICQEHDGVTEEIFRVGTAHGDGSVSKYGISFSSADLKGDGLATVTVMLPATLKPETVTEYIVDNYGAALNYLNQIESGIEEALTEVAAQHAAVLSHIEFMG